MNIDEKYSRMSTAGKADYAITRDMTGKMEGLSSISTSPLLNPGCIRRNKCNGSICKSCFSVNQMHRQKNTREKMERNTGLLTKVLLKIQEIPRIFTKLFRFEAFGDIHPGEDGERQLSNYRHIAEENADTLTALWSKSVGKCSRHFEKHSKPENMQFIASAARENPPEEHLEKLLAVKHVNKVFAVYSPEYAREHWIEINCGDKKCIECRWCYTGEGPAIIRELKK